MNIVEQTANFETTLSHVNCVTVRKVNICSNFVHFSLFVQQVEKLAIFST